MVCVGNALAEDFQQLFISKYQNEMLPEMRLAKTDRYKAQGLSAAQIENKLQTLIAQAAECQFKTFQAYSKKYQQVAFQSLLQGSTTEEASMALNEALQADVSQGEIDAGRASDSVKKAMNLYAACVVNTELVNP